MITFNDINEALRKEKVNPKKLQELPADFISEALNYFREKREISMKDGDSFSDLVIKTKRQLENAMNTFRDLMSIRKKKILELVFIATETGISKKDFDNMLDFEKDLFENLMKCFEIPDKKINEALNGKKEFTFEMEKIIFKEDVGDFMNLDGNKIGPFKKNEIAELPKQITAIFINSGKAEKVL